MSSGDVMWRPRPGQVEQSLLFSFITKVNRQTGSSFRGYAELYDWSVAQKELFWSMLWDFCGVIGSKGATILEQGDDIERARWFPEARLNFAENLLRCTDEQPAIIARTEARPVTTLSGRQLAGQVAAVAAWLRRAGVSRGDRVAGYLPNIEQAIVAMLATASIGAIWTSTSPDFGIKSVLERFGQTRPKVLFTVDGYSYNGKKVDIRSKVAALSSHLEGLEQTVIIDLNGGGASVAGHSWDSIATQAAAEAIEYEPCGFNDPLYILYSSGTTGKPKCIVHSVGGTLLQHLKEHQLHCDIRPADRVFYFTTCGWMMWNWLASVLASKATAVLYDGSPFYPDDATLWRYAEDVGMSLFGTSAKYLEMLRKRKVSPAGSFDLAPLRTICSTGSVLVPESFDYVYTSIKSDVCLASISGGTDIVSCFVLGCPILPVYRGECQCRGLGMAVAVFDRDGRPLLEQKGELVCTAPFPSQPVCFWGDESGHSYHQAYFATYDNVWHHGDYVRLTRRGGVIIYGRSDATLNAGGVRIGTAEIYRHVEQLDEVVESIVIAQEWQGDTRLVLFVVLRHSLVLSPELADTIRRSLRENCSPRHVPQKIIQVAAIPRTKSGKIVELAVRETVHGRPVQNVGALANPEALDLYRGLPELRH